MADVQLRMISVAVGCNMHFVYIYWLCTYMSIFSYLHVTSRRVQRLYAF
jgi:hypothetical protein